MEFKIPEYKAPDFTAAKLANAPDCRFEEADRDGVAPEYFHSTSMFPEYFKVNGEWKLAEESRMDSSVVLRPDGRLDVVENRNIRKGDLVALGRSEDGREGIYVHTRGFEDEEAELDECAVIRRLFQKRYAGKDMTDPELYRKAFQYFGRKGFGYDNIKNTLTEIVQNS